VQKLSAALQACHNIESKRGRARCEQRARKHYGKGRKREAKKAHVKKERGR
jgi:hypothetical protein